MVVLQRAGEFIESRLLVMVIATTIIGLAFPATGKFLSNGIPLLLALLMLMISLTIDLNAIQRVLQRPVRQLLALFLVYVPMSLLGLLTGRLFFGTGLLATGQTLTGTLPTDVSAPLLVLLAHGNVALAAVLNAINTVLSPFIVPFIFLILTEVELQVSIGAVIAELVLVVLLPTLTGVWLRTRYTNHISKFDNLYSAGGSLIYLVLLLAVLGPNAGTILGYGGYAFWIALACLTLNLMGYIVGFSAKIFVADKKDLIAYLFTVSKKEFSIAAAFISASDLPTEIIIPAVFYAVIQMITSPLAVKLLLRYESRENHHRIENLKA